VGPSSAGAAPWREPYRAWLDVLEPLEGTARLARLDAWAREAGLTCGSGRGLRFVPAGADAQAHGYEARIFESGEVATRIDGPGARHDLYNALAWLAWPRTKARLNALHAQARAADGPDAPRGPLRDAATLFDENAALWVGNDASLEAALRAFDWPSVFVHGRARLLGAVRVYVFGHALLEKLDAPYKGITAHAWPLHLPPDAGPATIDAVLATGLDAQRLSTRAFCPLPVLGMPGWCEANHDPAFYNDASVFRPGRRGTASRGALQDGGPTRGHAT
jgi:hypothetical protein